MAELSIRKLNSFDGTEIPVFFRVDGETVGNVHMFIVGEKIEKYYGLIDNFCDRGYAVSAIIRNENNFDVETILKDNAVLDKELKNFDISKKICLFSEKESALYTLLYMQRYSRFVSGIVLFETAKPFSIKEVIITLFKSIFHKNYANKEKDKNYIKVSKSLKPNNLALLDAKIPIALISEKSCKAIENQRIIENHLRQSGLSKICYFEKNESEKAFYSGGANETIFEICSFYDEIFKK